MPTTTTVGRRLSTNSGAHWAAESSRARFRPPVHSRLVPRYRVAPRFQLLAHFRREHLLEAAPDSFPTWALAEVSDSYPLTVVPRA
jgi:hypothetical protein